jgi:hypothetical protein
MIKQNIINEDPVLRKLSSWQSPSKYTPKEDLKPKRIDLSPPLPFALPELGEEEIHEVVDTLKSGWLTTGPKTGLFEKDFAEFVGTPHALAVNSATAGLHLALEAVGIGQGDQVITSPYTFTASAEVIRYLGADPVFVDINPKTFNIDPCLLETKLRELRNNSPGPRPQAKLFCLSILRARLVIWSVFCPSPINMILR